MTVSIDDIKKLRDATGVSMMACKKALEESGGEFEAAVDLLRKKGEAKAADRAERSTAQGAIVVRTSEGKAAMVQLLCETDFVAMSDEYLALANSVADKLLAGDISAEDKELPEIKEAVLKLGENIQIGEVKLFEAANIGEYVHSNRKIGVLVSLSAGDPEVAKDVAMHVAATNPRVISPDEISNDLVEKEKAIWEEQLKNEGKPAEILDKIMMGKEKKFREENALLKQAFVKNPDQTIEDLLSSAGASVEGFARLTV
jgi:elongation factor Ts